MVATKYSLNTGEIRQIQVLIALFLCIPPQSKLREVFNKALAASESKTLNRIKPCTDVSLEGLRDWFESLMLQGGLTLEEQSLLDWQSNSDNMSAAIKELTSIQDKTNLKIIFQQKSSDLT